VVSAVEVFFEAFRRLVGRRLRVRRIWLRLSQEDLAEKAEVSRNFVSAIERSAQVLDATRLGRVVVRAARVFGALTAYGRGEAAPGPPRARTSVEGSG
jgi:transcriptional regulator with XRE-family HTH domain